MYSVVLATMMATTPAAPDWHGCNGCYVSVNAFSCYGCCGYATCYGCGGYYPSCYGCGGYYSSCYGCGGYTCHGCYGCYGYSCWGCYGSGCYGCYGSVLYSYYPSCYCPDGVAPPAKAPEKVKLPKPMEDKKEDVSTVTIKVPANVRLTVDGQPLALSGTTQTFETPRLERGHTYNYVFRAEGQRAGKTVARERKVTVRAGEATQVDFSDLFGKTTAHVTIVLPSDATLIVNNVASYPQGDSKRTFDTPELELGRSYSYLLRAEVTRAGRLQQQEKRVEVEAGKAVTVEFKELPPLQSAQR